MTREDVLAMPAGRVLDDLVARRVMGWTRDDGEAYWRGGDVLMAPWATHNGTSGYRPSVEIGSAWTVVEEMRKRWHMVTNDAPRNLERGSHELQAQAEDDIQRGAPVVRYFCSFERDGGADAAWSVSETMPLAICRAALLTTLEETRG